MAVNTVERKITNVGKLDGVTLPQDVLKHMNAKRGDRLSFQLNDDGSITLSKKASLEHLDFIDDEDFIEGLNKALNQYEDGYKELVDR
ncbi:hypothetical protein DH09_00800 (plasmid) [Bacillaceae bacterium JMAK1]|nr:hypothetical protein DH09_00800 [Bacillaceae bacterium JMAK1]